MSHQPKAKQAQGSEDEAGDKGDGESCLDSKGGCFVIGEGEEGGVEEGVDAREGEGDEGDGPVCIYIHV